jgi:hypothetical protein
MTGTGGLRHRRVLLAASASVAVIVGHLLDALSLLPGVHESAAVRGAALAPSYTVLTVVGAVLLACAADALLRRGRPWVAVVILLAGQSVLLWVPEELAHAKTSGEGEEWGTLAVAVGLQVVLAAGAVGIAVLIDVLLLRLPRLELQEPVLAGQLPAGQLTWLPPGRVIGGVRGRGPPVPALS